MIYVVHCINSLLDVLLDVAIFKPSSQYAKNARCTFDATLKRKDRIDFYPCIADAPVDASDRTCHKFIAEISCVIIVRNSLDAW